MSDFCSNVISKTTQACPQCDAVCKSVEMRTLYHQVRFPVNQRVATGTYYFCPSKQCSIGYFSITGTRVPKVQLRTYRDILNDKLCYCFDIDADLYSSALGAHQADSIKDFIVQRAKSGECACEVRNPSGQCCLAGFKRLDSA